MNRGRKTRETVARIAGEEALAERSCVLLVAIRERRGKCALNKVRVSRVDPKRFAIVGLGRRRIAIGAGDEAGKIIAGLASAELGRLRVWIDRGGKTAGRNGENSRTENSGGDGLRQESSGHVSTFSMGHQAASVLQIGTDSKSGRICAASYMSG